MTPSKRQDLHDRRALLAKVRTAATKLQGRLDALGETLDQGGESFPVVTLLGLHMRLTEATGRLESAHEIAQRRSTAAGLFGG